MDSVILYRGIGSGGMAAAGGYWWTTDLLYAADYATGPQPGLYRTVLPAADTWRVLSISCLTSWGQQYILRDTSGLTIEEAPITPEEVKAEEVKAEDGFRDMWEMCEADLMGGLDILAPVPDDDCWPEYA